MISKVNHHEASRARVRTVPRRSPAALISLALAGLLLGGLATMLYTVYTRHQLQLTETLSADADEVKRDIQVRLDADRAFLANAIKRYAEVGAAHEILRVSLKRYADLHPHITAIAMRNADDLVRRGIVASLSPIESTRGGYTAVYVNVNGHKVFDLQLPVPAHDVSRGMVVMTYRCSGLIRHLPQRRVVQTYRLQVRDGASNVVSSLPSVRPLHPSLQQAARLVPPGNGLSVRLDRYATGFWDLQLAGLAATCALLVVAMAVVIHALGRQVCQRQAVEADLQTTLQDLRTSNLRLQAAIDGRDQAEEEAGRLQRRLAHLDRLGTLGELAAGLAHEINQPLGSIASFAQGCERHLKNDPETAPQILPAIQEIETQAQRAGKIVSRLRDMATDRVRPRAMCDIKDLTTEVVALFRAELRSCEVSLDLDTPENLVPVYVDAVQIQQVIANLLRNAITAVMDNPPRDRKVTLRTRAQDTGRLEMTITDNGPPCPPHVLRNMFDPFFTTKPSGMGVGLSISQSIVRRHEGELLAEANGDRGVTFSMVLPATAPGESSHSYD